MPDQLHGRVLHVAEAPHICPKPDIWEFGRATTSDVPTATMVFPVGSVWACDCGLVWVVKFIPTQRTRGGGYLAGGPCWRQERRRERRRRLGLSWWSPARRRSPAAPPVRVWRRDDAEPADQRLVLRDCQGDEWARVREGWMLIKVAGEVPAETDDVGPHPWYRVIDFAPLTEVLDSEDPS